MVEVEKVKNVENAKNLKRVENVVKAENVKKVEKVEVEVEVPGSENLMPHVAPDHVSPLAMPAIFSHCSGVCTMCLSSAGI